MITNNNAILIFINFFSRPLLQPRVLFSSGQGCQWPRQATHAPGSPTTDSVLLPKRVNRYSKLHTQIMAMHLKKGTHLPADRIFIILFLFYIWTLKIFKIPFQFFRTLCIFYIRPSKILKKHLYFSKFIYILHETPSKNIFIIVALQAKFSEFTQAHFPILNTTNQALWRILCYYRECLVAR